MPRLVLCLTLLLLPHWTFALETLPEAARQGKFALVETMLAQGADPNQQDANGMTALMYAAIRNNLRMIQLLLKNGSRLDVKSKSGYTAIKLAAFFENLEAHNALRQHAGKSALQRPDPRTQTANYRSFRPIVYTMFGVPLGVSVGVTGFFTRPLRYANYDYAGLLFSVEAGASGMRLLLGYGGCLEELAVFRAGVSCIVHWLTPLPNEPGTVALGLEAIGLFPPLRLQLGVHVTLDENPQLFLSAGAGLMF